MFGSHFITNFKKSMTGFIIAFEIVLVVLLLALFYLSFEVSDLERDIQNNDAFEERCYIESYEAHYGKRYTGDISCFIFYERPINPRPSRWAHNYECYTSPRKYKRRYF